MNEHDDACLCFPCYGIRLRKTKSIFATSCQGFNTTISDPYVHLSSVEEILAKKESDKKFGELWSKLYDSNTKGDC
jgi:hypothetical protein